MAVNKVEINGEPVIDLTEDSVSSDTLLEGYTAHDSSGEVITGTLNEVPMATSAKKVENALTFTGAVDAVYDGSSPVSVSIPTGGAGDSGAYVSKTGDTMTGNLTINAGDTSYIDLMSKSDASKFRAYINGPNIGLQYIKNGASPVSFLYHDKSTDKTRLVGNADTATKLASPVAINGVSFDGSQGITVTDSTKLPLTGGTLTGFVNSSYSAPVFGLHNTDLNNDLRLQIGANGNAGLIYREDSSTSDWKWLLMRSGTDDHTVYVYGRSDSTLKLANAKNINGVSFDGTRDITIADSTKLPLSGGTITGPLLISRGDWSQLQMDGSNGSRAILETNGSTLRMDMRNGTDSNNRRFLQLENPNSNSSIASALRFAEVIGGTSSYYRVFGQHNLEIQQGSVSITPVGSGMVTTSHLTFPKAFSGTPNVMVTPRSSVVGESVIGWGCGNPTNTGVDLYVTRTNTVNTILNWLAIYVV